MRVLNKCLIKMLAVSGMMFINLAKVSNTKATLTANVVGGVLGDNEITAVW